MEKLNDFIYRVMSSIQVILNVLVNLVFQPFYSLLNIIEGLAAIWCSEIEYDEEQKSEQQPQQQVTVYPSANEGRYAEDCDYPVAHKIGFKINQSEQNEINKIKEQLNQ